MFILHTVLAFHNYTQLELQGASHQKTTVNCVNLGYSSYSAGLTFTDVSNFSASNITFNNCSSLHNHTKVSEHGRSVRSALTFSDCENVRLTSVAIQNSVGFGLCMTNVVGNVYLEFCSFSDNNAESGGGGLYIEVNSNFPQNHTAALKSVYRLSNCIFKYNKAHTSIVYTKNEFRTFGQGGGLLISFRGYASHHQFRIYSCNTL